MTVLLQNILLTAGFGFIWWWLAVRVMKIPDRWPPGSRPWHP
jgi:hypothetical protein